MCELELRSGEAAFFKQGNACIAADEFHEFFGYVRHGGVLKHGDGVCDRFFQRDIFNNEDVFACLDCVGTVDETTVDFTAGQIVQHLTNGFAEDHFGRQFLVELSGCERAFGILSGGNGFGGADTDGCNLAAGEVVQRSYACRVVFGSRQYQRVVGKNMGVGVFDEAFGNGLGSSIWGWRMHIRRREPLLNLAVQSAG